MIRRLTSSATVLGIQMVAGLFVCGTAVRAEGPLPRGYIEEAPLPEGFPPPSEIGKVVEKAYPLARSYSATGSGKFMKCFGYLSLHKHKMTSPVVMEYKSPKGDNKKVKLEDDDLPVEVTRMHFLLEQLSQDEPKKDVLVEVADMPRMRVLSIAHQGRLSSEFVDEVEAKLAAKLKARPDLVSAGPTRILCYNGPSVGEDKVFWEIQLPVTARADIVDTAVGAGSFKTLVTALKAAALDEVLKGEGPFTVFAPTDEAFAKLPAGAVEALLKDKAKLKAVLTYHVVAGNVTAADVVKLKSAKTVQGQSVAIDATEGVMIDNAKVVKSDIICSNGVIHVIDTVLMPR
jgi:Fasciclin domain/SOUL heme-binding protein